MQLAANAHDPAIRSLILELLTKLQIDVDACYESDVSRQLIKRVQEMERWSIQHFIHHIFRGRYRNRGECQAACVPPSVMMYDVGYLEYVSEASEASQ